MAQHIESVKSSGIEQVTKTEFYAALRGGDLIFCSGSYAISRGIEAVTGSPFSHVLMAWLPYRANEWLTLESTAHKGVQRRGDAMPTPEDNYTDPSVQPVCALVKGHA